MILSDWQEKKKKKTSNYIKIRCLSTLSQTCNLSGDVKDMLMKQYQTLTKIKPVGVDNIFLCPYIDFIHGKQDLHYLAGMFSKSNLLDEMHYCKKENLSVSQQRIETVKHQIFSALHTLHSHQIYLGWLHISNFCLDDEANIKISEWGYYRMSQWCDFSGNSKAVQPYVAPEIVSAINQNKAFKIGPESDVWSVAIVLLEYIYGDTLPFYDVWQEAKNGKQTNIYSLIFEWISSQQVPEFLKACLSKERPCIENLIEQKVFTPFQWKQAPNLKLFETGISVKMSKEYLLLQSYERWKKSLEPMEFSEELRKNFPIGNYPTLFRLPSIYTYRDQHLEHTQTFFESASFIISGSRLMEYDKNRVPSIPGVERELNNYSSFANVTGDIRKLKQTVDQLPSLKTLMSDRDQDQVYQVERIKLFRKLLLEYPTSRHEIIKQANIDIPAVLRGEIWAAILGCESDEAIRVIYESIDTISPHSSDRQISVDVPRCHQYCSLLASKDGHLKLTKVLKAWVIYHEDDSLVYWQGIDSLLAPILLQNFYYEARAFGSLVKIINLYLRPLFEKDNSMAMDHKLQTFSKLLIYHEPEISNHMKKVGYYPELYGIPWFLTHFSHVLPVEKLFKLWDAFFLKSPHLPYFFGLAMIKRMKPGLLESDFFTMNKILQNTSGMNILECISDAEQLITKTPDSIVNPVYLVNGGMTMKVYKEIVYPRMTKDEFSASISQIAIILDVRDASIYQREHYKNAQLIDPSNDTDMNSFFESFIYKRGLPIVIIPDSSFSKCFVLEEMLFSKNIPYVSVLFV